MQLHRQGTHTHHSTKRAGAAIIAGLAVIIFALAGCSRGGTTPTPPDIRYGEDACTQCQMIISDPRFAAAYAHEVAPGRFTSLAFDDIADMVGYAQSHPEHTVAAWYVHDYFSEESIDAATATYVQHRTIAAPMGSGLAAFADAAAARKFANEIGGEVWTWYQVHTSPPALTHKHSDHAH